MMRNKLSLPYGICLFVAGAGWHVTGQNTNESVLVGLVFGALLGFAMGNRTPEAK